MRLNYIDCIDCLEGLKEIPDGSVDLVLTDPPYGINYASAWIKDKSKRLGGIMNDKTPFLDFIELALKKLKPSGAAHIFTRWDVQQTFIDRITGVGGRVKNVCIWDKCSHGMGDLRSAYGSRYESILFVPGREFCFPGKRPQDIIAVAKVPATKLVHPTQKPVELVERLILDTTRAGDVVLDPFMGSGTTAVACLKTGRNYIGFELDEGYHAIAQKRVADTVDELMAEEEIIPQF